MRPASSRAVVGEARPGNPLRWPVVKATVDNLVQDLRCAIRSLLRQPSFALTAILTLALGIGATTTMIALRTERHVIQVLDGLRQLSTGA